MADEGFDDYHKVAWQEAMNYLSIGWSIIPIRLSDKMPAIEWRKYQDAAPDEDVVTDWFENGVPDGCGGYTRAFGLGVITGKVSGLVVLDCDNQEAVTYAVSEAGLFSMLTVKTTRGQHLYFKHPDTPVQNKVGGTGRDWPDVHGLDLRGDGGYVVAPPSLKFNEDGSLRHQYSFNCPSSELEGIVPMLPVWRGITLRTKVKVLSADEWSFDKLNLTSIQSNGADVWHEMSNKVKLMGRKMTEGDGRNLWLVRYLGECIASGMDEEQARLAGAQFQEEFYESALPTIESETVLQSVITSDKRNHPEKYAEKEKYESKSDERKSRANAIKLIRPNNLAEMRRMGGDDRYFVKPFVPAGAIIQVVGFNGHGKSLWLFYLLWAISKGMSFGSAHVDKELRTLYFDFEGSSSTLIDRIEGAEGLLGPMSENMTIWNAAVADDDMSLNDGEGITKFGEYIEEVNPHIVVIDTVRQAWLGMEENAPHAWIKVNQLAMAIRQTGRTVILVHHRNKPSMNGHGREAGSTAQLKDLDLQVIVTKVVESDDQAKREAAIPDMATSITDFSGVSSSAWNYLRRTLPASSTLRIVFELSFGKMRAATENHIPTYIGLAEDNETGKWCVVSSLTPLQKAVALDKRNTPIADISNLLNVSQPTIRNWLKKGVK